MPLSFVLRTTLLALVAAPLLGGCAATPKKADPELPYPPPRAPEVGDILHLPTGTFVSEPHMLDVVTDARIVYVGETHDNPASHRIQLRILQALHERCPGQVALGMEMFTPAQQPVLDRWIAGELSEKEFLRQSGWYEQWRMDFDYYRDLLLFARDQGIAVIGLNAEKDLVRAIGRGGLEGLDPDQRSRLPEMDMEDPYHRAMVQAIYGGHSEGNAGLEGFMRIQTLWDETMAENVARFLSDQGKTTHLLVVAGGNHVKYGFGIPRRVFRRLPASYALVGSREIVIPEERREKLMDVEMPGFPLLPYDFTVFTEYESLPERGVRLGVVLQQAEGEVKVERVLPGSVAEEAGLQSGDVLVALDGEAVEDTLDVIHALRQLQPGARATLDILRDNTPLRLEIFFTPAAQSDAGS